MKRSHQQGLERKCYQKLCKTLDLEERQIKEFDCMSEECGVRRHYQSIKFGMAHLSRENKNSSDWACIFVLQNWWRKTWWWCMCNTRPQYSTVVAWKSLTCVFSLYTVLCVVSDAFRHILLLFMTKSLTISCRCRQQQQQIAARNEHVPPHLKSNTKRVMYEYLTPHLQ